MAYNHLRNWRFLGACIPWRIAAASRLWKGEGAPVQFAIENADWAIRWVGEHICKEINIFEPGSVEVTVSPERLSNRIVHFGSQYMWLDWGVHMPRGNKFVTSFFHGKREDGPDVSEHIDRFLQSVPKLSTIVTAAGLVERRLLSWGVPREKLIRIPIGVDTEAFNIPSPEEKRDARNRFSISPERVVVGSFQKDGIGWGDGEEPKFIKGPDILVSSLAKLKQLGVPVTAFLTGPARGYVKKELTRLGVPFVHTYIKNHSELSNCYHALDIYFVTSREEGGPMGLMESMASGVPVVSTYVGMAPDLIADGLTGGLVESEDGCEIAAKAMQLLDRTKQDNFIQTEARKAVLHAGWPAVAREHWLKVYKPLLNDG